jgi:hypothetical protein
MKKMVTSERRLRLWWDQISSDRKECYSSRTDCVMLRAVWMVTETVGMSCALDWISAFATKAKLIVWSTRPQTFTGIWALLHLMTSALYNRPGNQLSLFQHRCVFFAHTYLLTSWSRVPLEKLTCLHLVKNVPAFYVTRIFIRNSPFAVWYVVYASMWALTLTHVNTSHCKWRILNLG